MSRKRVRRIMRRYGQSHPVSQSGMASDLTYIRLPSGFVYLVANVDLYSRKVLSWRLSNSMDPSSCVEALEEAIETYGEPVIFNTDQGSQFIGDAFIAVLSEYSIEICMDGKGRAPDNVYVDIYLHSYETMPDLREGVERYYMFYNAERFHQSLETTRPRRRCTDHSSRRTRYRW